MNGSFILMNGSFILRGGRFITRIFQHLIEKIIINLLLFFPGFSISTVFMPKNESFFASVSSLQHSLHVFARHFHFHLRVPNRNHFTLHSIQIISLLFLLLFHVSTFLLFSVDGNALQQLSMHDNVRIAANRRREMRVERDPQTVMRERIRRALLSLHRLLSRAHVLRFTHRAVHQIRQTKRLSEENHEHVALRLVRNLADPPNALRDRLIGPRVHGDPQILAEVLQKAELGLGRRRVLSKQRAGREVLNVGLSDDRVGDDHQFLDGFVDFEMAVLVHLDFFALRVRKLQLRAPNTRISTYFARYQLDRAVLAPTPTQIATDYPRFPRFHDYCA